MGIIICAYLIVSAGRIEHCIAAPFDMLVVDFLDLAV